MLSFCEATASKCEVRTLRASVQPMSGKDICPALSALASRQFPVNLVSAVGKSVTWAT